MSLRVLTADDVKRLRETRENAFFQYIVQHPVPEPQSVKDLTMVRLNNMEEKIKILEGKATEFCDSESNSKKDSTYWSLSETCVKFQIALDSINVIGREDQRQRKRTLLMKVDELSTNLVRKIQEQNKKNGS